MTDISSGEVFKKHFDASLKHTKFEKGANEINFEKPNLFYYVPTLFTQVNGYMTDHDYDPMLNLQNAMTQAIGIIKNGKTLPRSIIVNMSYKCSPVVSSLQDFTMDITARLFDDKASLLLENTTTGYEFKHSVPNHSYLTACVRDGNTKWDGVIIAFPTLPEGRKYYLEVIETYHLNIDEFLEDNDVPKDASSFGHVGDFTRKMIFPLNIDETHSVKDYQAHWNANFDPMFNIAFSVVTRSDDDVSTIEPIRKKFSDDLDLSAIGAQSAFLGLNNVPRILVDPTSGVFVDYYGKQSDFLKNINEDLNSHNIEVAPEFKKLMFEFTKEPSSIPYVAALIGTHFRHAILGKTSKCLDHNGLGSEVVNFQALLAQGTPREKMTQRYIDPLETKEHKSRYDFEELVPSFTLPNMNIRAF